MSTKRTFTKRLTVANTAAAWAIMAFSIYLGAAEIVVPALGAMIVGLYAAYTGTGVLDYRTAVDAGRAAGEGSDQ